MKPREKVELALIALAVAGTWAAGAHLPPKLPLGEIILAASVLLLTQGLLRDLWIKYGAPRAQSAAIPPAADAAAAPKSRKILCMCVESTVGAAGVIAGCALLLAGLRAGVSLPREAWTAIVCGVLLLGFLIKDLVLDWQTKSIRREPDHASVIFW